jgi:hypothetical protein
VIFICNVCKRDRFTPGRQMNLVTYQDGSVHRDWGSGPDDGNLMECVTCHSLYQWDPKKSAYVIIKTGGVPGGV